jgi:O-methyltransferase
MISTLSRIINKVLGLFGLCLRRVKSSGSWSHQRSPELLHSRLTPSATYSPWLSDPEFLDAYELIKSHTLVDLYRCYELWDQAQQSCTVGGSILEVGVWRGGTGCLLAIAARQKTVYLADNFEGVVKAGEHDTGYVGGEHADTSALVVENLLASAKVNNAQLLKGIFPDQTADAVEGTISLLHVDVDVYRSAQETVLWALPRMPLGARIVFDDYGFFGCEGVTRLVNELRNQLSDWAFVYNLNGHAIFIRISPGEAPVSPPSVAPHR